MNYDKQIEIANDFFCKNNYNDAQKEFLKIENSCV